MFALQPPYWYERGYCRLDRKEPPRERFSIRGTVRSVKKAEALKTFFADHAEFAIVEGIAADGAPDDAAKGKRYRTEAFVGPAVRGTTGILKSVQAHGPSVKCTVTISSVGTVCSYPNGDGKLVRVFTGADRNDEDIVGLEKQGKNADVATKYRSSKVLRGSSTTTEKARAASTGTSSLSARPGSSGLPSVLRPSRSWVSRSGH
ncbi:hypothetical protein L227DRAFT_562944 [Lentinus tigrinus ALCF2SS1-6]|uniref:Uncharacterized protein n=1 Tax=Lentinus tigrinus ALCF2SS1-6 TaxID=1328759 RepID=A0A5C2SCD4_9APHY|nr:hypothetical protein L227DRAFT_562944 [Lentinus tigrinus ALCF2SS1-6]